MTTIVTRAGKGSPLTNAELDQNFLNLNSAKLEASDLSPYLLSATAASTYQTIAGMSSYLTTAGAASTYLSQANAASTYQTQAAMSSYLTTANAASTYLTQANAASTYQAQSGMSSYLTTASAASTYQTQAGMSSYLTIASAGSTYLPLAGGTLTGNLTFGGTSQKIIGDFTSATRLLVQTNSANSNTVFGLIPNGTAVNSQFHVWGASDITNAPLGALTINSSAVQIQSTAAGTGTILPFRVLVGSTEVFRATTAANFLIGTTTDNGTDKLQVTGSGTFTSTVTASGFSGSGASLTSLTAGNLSGTIPSAVLGNSTHYIGTTAIALNRSSLAQTLTGVSIDGNAATVTSITSSQVTTALGFTPYNATNPSGYITSSALSPYLTTATAASTYAPIASPTFSGTVSDGSGSLRAIPAVGTKTASYTLAKADVGKYVQVSTGGSITIPTGIFAEGDVVSLFNNTTGNVTITSSALTAYKGGTNSVVTSLTLNTRGVATVFFISGSVCVVTGNLA